MSTKSAKNEKEEQKETSLYHSGRVYIAMMLMLAFYCTISMRSHIGVAMVCMVNATAIKENAAKDTRLWLESGHEPRSGVFGIESPFEEAKCAKNDRNLTGKHVDNSYRVGFVIFDFDELVNFQGTFVWSTEEQSLIFSAGFYGNVLIMLFSGFLVDRFGPYIVALISMLGMTITIMLTPFVAHLDFYLLFLLRMIFGIFENPILPAMSDAVARWFPRYERSTIAAFFTSGNQLSASLGVVIASKFCELDFLQRWPLIFYLSGLLGCIWIAFWICFGSSFPSKSKWLSQKEKDYLFEQNEKHFTTFRQRKESGLKMPLKEMIFSTATLAVVMGQFSLNFSNSMMQTYLPTYLRDVMNLDLNHNGMYTAVPFFVQLFSKNLLGNIADYLKKRQILTPSSACRVFQSIASFGGALVYLIMAFHVDCSTPNAALLLLAIFGFCFGGAIPGFFTSSLYIAPSFTGMIASFTLVAGCFGNILAPAVVAILVKQGTRFEWSVVFFCVAIINVLGGGIFFVYGTAKIQPWAKVQIPTVAATSSTYRGAHNRNNAIRGNRDPDDQMRALPAPAKNDN